MPFQKNPQDVGEVKKLARKLKQIRKIEQRLSHDDYKLAGND